MGGGGGGRAAVRASGTAQVILSHVMLERWALALDAPTAARLAVADVPFRDNARDDSFG